MSDFHQRKAERRDWYFRFEYGWRQRPCSSCMGTGRYDHNGSPPCGACDGTGRERYKYVREEVDGE